MITNFKTNPENLKRELTTLSGTPGGGKGRFLGGGPIR